MTPPAEPLRAAASPARTLAPGARVVIRDEEWTVRTIKPANPGGQAVHVTGVSELVRNKEAIFLTELDAVLELRPEETELVDDDSPRYRRSRLYLEALLRRTPPTDDAIVVGHRGAIRRADYQLQPAAKALRQLRPRILMADGVGLGKTIEVGILLSELIKRGRGDRILVVALKSILEQFQQELWSCFTIPLVRLDSVGIQRIQSRIPSAMNPFHYYDRCIISIDTLKKVAKYRRYLESCHWDVVVVDECQHVAVRTTGGSTQRSQRARLAQLLARTSDALIFTSATPHDGRSESFASLLNLLEPTAVADQSSYTHEEVEHLFIRRFKKDIAHELAEGFKERQLHVSRSAASAEEDAVFRRLDRHSVDVVAFQTVARARGGKGVLFRTLLLKAFLSSPAACAATLEHRLAHKDLQNRADPAVEHDRAVLQELLALVRAVTPARFGKLAALVGLLRNLGIGAAGGSRRVVVFSERIDTLHFLAKQLTAQLGLAAGLVEIFHGQLDDQRQQELVKGFGTKASPIRVLLASDVASEGINLHYYCHHLVHFDLPWSLITLEQRNGRIDRFGQNENPQIHTLLTVPGDPGLQGDLRVLDRLIEKEDNAHRQLGDVAWLLGLHDAEKEEGRIAAAIEAGKPAEEVIPEVEEVIATDWLAMLTEDQADEPAAAHHDPFRLFADDLAYAREAFAEAVDDAPALEWHDHLAGFTLVPPPDLAKRFETLPPELRARGEELKLTVDRERVMAAREESRQEEERWPEWQLFWELHPVAQWLDDRILARFGRHEAPVLRVGHGLTPADRVFVFQGVIANGRSQPIVVDWFGIHFEGTSRREIQSLAAWAERTGLVELASNPGRPLGDALHEGLLALRGSAVLAARDHMLALRNQRAEGRGAELREELRALARWGNRRLAQITDKRAAAETQRTLRSDEAHRFESRQHEIEATMTARRTWVEEGFRTVGEPYLRLALVLVSTEAR